MTADVWVGGDNIDCLVGHVFGVGGGEAYSHLGEFLGDESQQAVECHGVVVAKSVGVDVLAEERDLTVSLVGQVADFAENRVDGTAAFAATCIGHNAIGAEIVAAAHNRDKARHPVAGDSGRDDFAVCFGGRQLDIDGFFATLGGGKKGGEVEVGVGTGDEVDTVVFDEGVADTFGHASDYADDEPWRSAAFAAKSGDLFKAMDDFLLGVVAYGASVEKDGIGQGDIVGDSIAGHFKDRGDDFRVGDIHLTSVCFDEKTSVCVF